MQSSGVRLFLAGAASVHLAGFGAGADAALCTGSHLDGVVPVFSALAVGLKAPPENVVRALYIDNNLVQNDFLVALSLCGARTHAAAQYPLTEWLGM